MATGGVARDRLIAVAGELLAEGGVEALSLRAIARGAGVSHSAPLRHFPSLANLLAHVSGDGFAALQAAVGAAVGAIGTDASSRARLVAAGRAYAAFAMAHPGPFRLMFRFDLVDRGVASLATTSHAAFDQLVGLVAGAQAEGWRSGEDPRLLAGAVWGAVHGLVSLWLDEAIQPATGAQRVEELLDPLLSALVQLHEEGCR